MDYDHQGNVNQEKRIAILVILLVVAAVIGYMGYRQFMKWHENKLQSAVSEQQQKMAEKSAEFEYQIIELQNKLIMLEPPPVSDDRLTEVFGKTTSASWAVSKPEDISCDALKNKITSFYNYLQGTSLVNGGPAEKKPSDVFLQMVRALSATPPMIVNETRDIVSLKHNQAHFFRVLRKDKFQIVKNFLTIENDVLEHAMADFYAYYACGNMLLFL